MTDSTLTVLTHEEEQAGLTLEQLKQLVGLVDYDASTDPFPVIAQDAVCFVVGNATQTATFYQLAFGMDLEAYRGPETGHRESKSYVLRSGSARFVFTGGVWTAASSTPGPRGRPCSSSPTTSPTTTARSGWRPSRRTARPATPLSTARSTTAPTCPATSRAPRPSRAVRATPSGCSSKVVASGNHRVKFPLNEPAVAKKKSQIDEYLEFYDGAGCQHIALATNDILRSVDILRDNGIEFLETPDSYYDDPELRARIGEVRVPIEELKKRKILVDRDEDGYLLQIFTRPMGDRPTVFYEFIERHGSLGFGKGNFKALFEAIEREQDARGNL
jgi:hypothetical protein